jgi:hypothetical protein
MKNLSLSFNGLFSLRTYVGSQMPTCNLAETMHNKWLHQSGYKMTCLYEAIVDDMIREFMQIAN